MRTDEVRRGQQGTGWTVVRGTQPEPFSVEVLGVLRNGIAPGRDMIIVDTAGPAIDQARGIWYGMSGSPIYVNGRLLGAIAFGLSFGPSSIAGVTPAQDMYDVLRLPQRTDSAEDRSFSAAATPPRKVALSAPLREAIAEHKGIGFSDVGSELERLRMPLSISGASRRTLDRFREAARRAGAPLIPFAGAAASASVAAEEAPQPGGNIAGVLSYGDITAAGVGTTTAVCDDRLVAFGHPFFFAGPTGLGANAADALAIVDDPVFGPYKLANVTGAYGTVDQDRLAAIRATLGPLPALTPITSEVIAADTGRSREGLTEVAYEDYLGLLALFHALGNIDSTFDQLGEGSSQVATTITGRREDGSSWRYRRTNRFASRWDIAFESVLEMFGHLSALQENALEQVTIDSVDVDARVEETLRRYEIGEVLVATDGVTFLPLDERDPMVEARPGDTLSIKVVLKGFRSRAERVVGLELRIPDEAAGGGFVEIAGGGGSYNDPFGCIFWGECGAAGEEIESFDALLATLEEAPRNDDVVAKLTLGEHGGEPTDESTEHGGDDARPSPRRDEEPTVVSARVRVDQVVDDFAGFRLNLPGPMVERIAGEDRAATAVALSQATRPAAETVLLARADSYADALAAAPLAAQLEAPVLLSDAERLPAAVAEEIRRLGARAAVLLGGPGALSAGVEEDLRAAGVQEVERIAGSNRFETARLIAERVGGTEVYVAQGSSADPARGWPDAVAVSGVAALQRRPILLVETERVPEETRRALDELGVTSATVVGGAAAVSPAVEASLRSDGRTVDRVAGSTRYGTSRALAHLAVDAGADPGRVFFVTGRNYPDALAAAPAAAAREAVLLLVDGEDLDHSPPAREWLAAASGHIDTVTLVGGFSAINGFVEQQIVEQLFGGGCGPDGCEPPPCEDGACPSPEEPPPAG